jgi:uncharacterized Zn finger protein (UPF0148 family)
MPKLTCPSCELIFETAGNRYTNCPSCGVRIDTRSADGVIAISKPRRAPSQQSNSLFDTDVEAEPERKSKPTKQKTIIIKTQKTSDAAPKAMLALAVAISLAVFVVVVILGVTLYYVSGPSTPIAKVVGPQGGFPSGTGGGGSVGPNGNPPLPPPGPGLFQNSGGDGVPTPKGNLPGVDPAELPGGAVGSPDDDITNLLPPELRPPPGPGRPGFGPPRIGGPGAPGMPGLPGGPGPQQPATILVTLSNLRVSPNNFGRTELLVDFEYFVNSTPNHFDVYMLKTPTQVFEIRPIGIRRNKGTMALQPNIIGQAGGNGPFEIWMERKVGLGPLAQSEVISNKLTK